MLKELLSRRVLIVLGKGGAGNSKSFLRAFDHAEMSRGCVRSEDSVGFSVGFPAVVSAAQR
jgi:hypothetical protein